MLRRRAFLGLAAGLLVAVTAACGDSDDGGNGTTGTPTTEATIDVAARSPADLASYRFSVDVVMLPSVLDVSEAPDGLTLDSPMTIQMEGERQNPDRERTRTTADLVFLQVTTETIDIGDRRWLRESNRPWVEGETSPLEAYAALAFRPALLFGEDEGRYDELARELNQLEWTADEVDGVPTRRFDLDNAQFAELFLGERSVLPPELNANVSAVIWLERELGTPVRLEVTGTDEAGEVVLEMEIVLWDFDSESIQIEPPQ